MKKIIIFIGIVGSMGIMALFHTGCGTADKAVAIPLGSSMELSESAAKDKESSAAAGEDGRITDNSDAESGASQEAERIYVHVCGAVVLPGVFQLPAGSRGADALALAGGYAAEADRDYINLAAKLEDGQKLYFPTREEADVLRTEESRETGQAQDALVNINTADEAGLCTLTGIGASRAKDIIAYREAHGAFRCKEDIMQVSGIKESTYQKICNQITVE